MEVMQQPHVMENTKQAMHHPHLQEEEEEDLEEVVEEALLKRRTTSNGSTHTTSSSTSSAAETNGDDVSATNGEAQEHDGKPPPQSSVYFDKNEGNEVGWSQYNVKVDDLPAKLKDVDVQKVLSAIINGKEDGISSSTLLTKKEPETSATSYELEESDEEVVELEFETAVERMHTHTDYNMYCPNCRNRITKVVLRRKIRQRPAAPVSSDNECRDLFGCLSCFSIFVSCGNRLNPFRIFSGRDSESPQLPQEQPLETTQLLQQQPTPSDVIVPAQSTPTPEITGRRFDPFWLFRKGRDKENSLTSPLLTPRDEAIEQGQGANHQKKRDDNKSAENGLSGASNDASADYNIINAVSFRELILGKFGSNGVATLGKLQNNGVAAVIPTSSPPHGSTLDKDVIIDVSEKHETLIHGVKQPIQPGLEIKGEIDGDNQLEVGDVSVPVEETPVVAASPTLAAAAVHATTPLIVTESGSSRSLEVVKSVVYGGLMESMASLTVVSSAAASDATTLNIVALGLANLVGGLVVLAHNLKDLRYGDSSPASENRYKEQLGRKEHFIIHATVAVLSYIVFGLLPPVTYGFAFRESDDRDYTMLAVAALSFLCIFILAIAKAYVRWEHTFTTYFKTVLYYVTSAAAASGVAFAVGDLAKKLVERLGWLDPPATLGSQIFLDPNSFQPTWASY